MWFQTSLRAKKMFLFLLMKCQKPYRLTVAKLYVISLEGYCRVCVPKFNARMNNTKIYTIQ